MTKYDVIIVGAGPAGSVTARYIDPARSGLSVLLLDAKRVVGLPRQCGEALPTYRDVKRLFPRADCPELFDLPPSVVASPVHGLQLALPRGRTYFADVVGLTIYRDRLDQWLCDQAVEAGAEVRLQARVRKVEGARVVTDRETFTGTIIVGADGPQSLVSASFPAFTPNRVLAPCAFVIAAGDFFERHLTLWVDRRFPGGYCWLFPKQGEANIGLGMRGGRHLRPLLEHLLAELRRERAFTVKERGGGLVPLGGLKRRVAWRHVALVGDAAGMAFPTNGGGTAQAMLSGQLLGEVIGHRLPLEAYQRRVDEAMRPAFRASLRTDRLIDLARRSDRVFLALMGAFHRRGWKRFIVG